MSVLTERWDTCPTESSALVRYVLLRCRQYMCDGEGLMGAISKRAVRLRAHWRRHSEKLLRVRNCYFWNNACIKNYRFDVHRSFEISRVPLLSFFLLTTPCFLHVSKCTYLYNSLRICRSHELQLSCLSSPSPLLYKRYLFAQHES